MITKHKIGKNRSNLKKLGENGYNYCKQNFSIDKILLKYNDILKTLCCSKLDNYQ